MNKTYISRYTPSIMKHEELEAIFVQREELAKRIEELIFVSCTTKSKHYTLLIGPRGIGKTHLVSLLYYRTKAKKELRDKILIAWCREEEWGVSSLLDFLLRIFRALFEEYQDEKLEEQVESLYGLSSDTALQKAQQILIDYVGEKTLFVIVENLSGLFDGLGDEGQKRLRSFIQEHPFWTILATSTSLFNGVSLQKSPFYGFFRIQHLEALDIENATQLLTQIAELNNDNKLAEMIPTALGRSRIRAVHHLGGGNHRVYVIFSHFLTCESLDQLVQPLMSSLDDLTPYYQSRLYFLSPQQRKIAEHLCNRRHAVSVKEIAQQCFMTHQTASSQLKSLKDMGYVISDQVGRDSYYELREPLMRMCLDVKKHRGEPIRLLVEFLRIWYTKDELQERLNRQNSDEKSIIQNLFENTIDKKKLQSRIKSLVEVYKKHDVLTSLGQGVVRSIPALYSPMASDAAVQQWFELWKEQAGKYSEFQIPLRILDVAVRFRPKHDRRVLYGLPIEERKILEEVLNEIILEDFSTS